MDAEQLAAIRQRVERATPGPYHGALPPADAALVHSARGDVLALLAALDEARAERDSISATLGAYTGDCDELRAERDAALEQLHALQRRRQWKQLRLRQLLDERDAARAEGVRLRAVLEDIANGDHTCAYDRYCKPVARAALAGRDEPGHPEDACQRCGRPNISWVAPNALWNTVMGSPNGIVCPVCFVRAAQATGIDPTWRLEPDSDVDGYDVARAALAGREEEVTG